MPTVQLALSGNTFAVIDYLSAEGTQKRVFAILSGDGPGAVEGRLRALDGLGPAKEVEVVDLRGEVSGREDAFELGLGQYISEKWYRESKKSLLRLGALGPGGSAEMKLIRNEDFWRF